ncbi:MAG: hypothetical protein AB7Q17_18050 [Phycisphaerae bacterium]
MPADVLPLLMLFVLLDEPPPALLAAQRARAAEQIRTARIEYSVQWPSESESEFPHTYFYSYQAAGDDYLTIAHGDEERVVMRGPDGEPATQYTYRGPIQSLYLDGSIWQKQDQEPEVRRWRGSRQPSLDMLDPRRVGLTPLGLSLSLDDDLREAGRPTPQYTERQDGDMVVVHAKPDGPYELEWRIDPARNYAITEMTLIHQGRVVGREAIDLQLVDGCWFPRRVQNFAYYEDGEKVKRTIDILHAELNHSEHSQKLTPAQIGVEVGTHVVCADPEGLEHCANGFWDGQRVVSAAEYFLRREAGELRPGPNVAREMSRAVAMTGRWQALGRIPALRGVGSGSAIPPRPGLAAASSRATTQPTTAPVESEWERYTREFIARYRLTADQVEQAMTILRDCQKRAAQHVRDQRPRFEELERRTADADKLTGAARAAEDENVAALRAALRAPIDEIFEREIKPRLDKLPTTAQRSAAASASPAATQSRLGSPRP